jgi:hypothetical protein
MRKKILVVIIASFTPFFYLFLHYFITAFFLYTSFSTIFFKMSKIFFSVVLFDRDEPGSFPFNFEPGLKKTFNLNKGSTRIILDETFKIRDEHENCVFTIEINRESTIKKFKRKIKKKIKERLNKRSISNDIHLNLWKVSENIISLKIMIKGTIDNYWSEQPSDDFIHIFVDYYSKPIILNQHLTG